MSIVLRTGRFIYRKLGLSRNHEFRNKPFDGMLNAKETNSLIAEIIMKGKPAMITRFGTPESNCLLNHLELQRTRSGNLFVKMHALLQNKRTIWEEYMKEELISQVGFFPVDNDSLLRFSNFYTEQIKKTDLIGIWGFVPGETYLINKYCPKAVKFDPIGLEPYYFENPWSEVLAGKKILVIHPFAQSIRQQYLKREFLFENKKILPAFELINLQAIQSNGGNETSFKTWFDALEWMQQ